MHQAEAAVEAAAAAAPVTVSPPGSPSRVWGFLSPGAAPKAGGWRARLEQGG